MVARVLGAAPVLADAIIDQLAAPSDRATDAGGLCSVRPMCCFQCVVQHLEQHFGQQACRVDSTPELLLPLLQLLGCGQSTQCHVCHKRLSIHMLHMSCVMCFILEHHLHAVETPFLPSTWFLSLEF